jgi:hypothetical protein
VLGREHLFALTPRLVDCLALVKLPSVLVIRGKAQGGTDHFE